MTDMPSVGTGMAVVSRDDPGRRGQIVAGPRTRSDGTVYRVRWNDGTSGWTPEYAFERMDGAKDDPFMLLEKRRFGRLDDLRRNLMFIQLNGKLADVVYSMDTTNTEFMPYQYKPVLTFLESPSNGILIADEVGLGKTIEAGLIWTELRARYGVRRLVVVCPAMLCEKWKMELDTKFGIDSSQLDAAQLARELKRNKNSIWDGKGYVCSLQGLRPPKGWNEMDEQNGQVALANVLKEFGEESTKAIDLLVIDEAHHLRNRATQNAEIGRLLREVSEHVVLLSATPVNNRANDLYELLHLLDPDSFDRADQFDQILSANEPLISARNLALDPTSTGDAIKNRLQAAIRHGLLAGNRQLNGLLSESLSADFLGETANRIALANRIERINLLRHTINRTRKVEVEEGRVVREAGSHFKPLNPEGPERDFYNKVTRAVRQYASDHDIRDGFLLCAPQRQMSSCMYAAARSWMGQMDSDVENQLYEDVGETADASNAKTSTDGAKSLIAYIKSEVLPGFDVESLRRQDTKFEDFNATVHQFLAEKPDEKLVVFSYFKATLKYLHERLAGTGIRSQILHGSISENKQMAIDRFRDSKEIQVLLASEVASEGVDLQFCSVLFNYDLPWNPMKIEQRIGRIDRIGQKANKIQIRNMGLSDTIDERIYTILLEKLDIFRRSLGDMEMILGKRIKDLTSELMSQELTPDQEKRRIEQAYLAVEKEKQQQDELEAKAGHLIAHGGYILERVKAAHDFSRRITERDLKIFVKDYLFRFVVGFEFEEDDNDPSLVSIRLPFDFAARFNEYVRKVRLQNRTRLVGGERIRCRFRNRIDRTKGLEIISQFHPLIRFIGQDLKERSEDFCKLVAVEIPSVAAPFTTGAVYAFSCQQWTFMGLRTEETLQARVIALDGESDFFDRDESWSLVNAARTEGSDWLSSAQEVSVEQVRIAFDKCDEQLQKDYEIECRRWKDENTDRMRLQKRNAERHHDRTKGRLSELLNRYRKEENTRLIPPTEGKIQKLDGTFGVQMEDFRKKEQVTSQTSEVCYGVIRMVRRGNAG